MASKKEVIHFIATIRRSFTGSVLVYTRGSCYQFYKILKAVYPNAIAYYDSNHVITKIGRYYFDITGETKRKRHLKVDKHYSHENLDKLGFIIDAESQFKNVVKNPDVAIVRPRVNLLTKLWYGNKIDVSQKSIELAKSNYNG